ncbi:MAG: hypothetical protein JO104_03690 [Candidatus Eremiobacteraeota bacterium]|nr:hypothetical protein [Candidatus Eremiobacteraeota bacterium]
MTTAPRSSTTGLLPLVVGVTGHRDLDAKDTAAIVAQVRELFVTLERRCPHTPVILLSSLAEGADRLVAQTALECGAELYVVLPMPVALYEQDFTSPHSLAEFRQLMSRSYDSSVAPMGRQHDNEEAQTPGPARDLRYAAAGAFLVSYSQILIALWDGNQDEMPGGTSQIVRFALRGVPAKFLGGPMEALRANETGAVYHVAVRRQSSAPSNGFLSGTAWRYPGSDASPEAVEAARTAFEENLRNLERFNRDAVTAPIEWQRALSSGYLLTSQQEASLKVDGALAYTRTLFGQADALALRCRNGTHAATIVIFGAIGIATVLFSLYTNVLNRIFSLYLAFMGVVAAAFCVDLLIARRRMQDRFQDYRALAEGLRVQFYWRLAGIPESVYDHYLARQEGELNWIRSAMRAARFRRHSDADVAVPAEKMRGVLEIVLGQWINDQVAYFSRAVGKERELANRIKSGATFCLVVTAIVALALAIVDFKGLVQIHPYLVMVLTMALAGAGLFTGYAQKRAHEEHARRYQRMYVLYSMAGDRVTFFLREGEIAAARGVLVQLGREALAETCDWLLLHRERQIDVPTG